MAAAGGGGGALPAALRLLARAGGGGGDEAAVAGLLVLARHVPRADFAARRAQVRAALAAAGLLPRLLATRAEDGGFQRLAVAVLAALAEDEDPPARDAENADDAEDAEDAEDAHPDDYEARAWTPQDRAAILAPLQTVLARDLAAADDEYALEIMIALRAVIHDADDARLDPATVTTLVHEAANTPAGNPQRGRAAAHLLHRVSAQVTPLQAVKLAKALHAAATSEDAAGCANVANLLAEHLAVLPSEDIFIADKDVVLQSKTDRHPDASARAQDALPPMADAVFALLKRTSRLDATARGATFALASTLCERAGPAWPLLTTEDLGSGAPVSFFLRMLGVELEVCFTDARYIWVESSAESSAAGNAETSRAERNAATDVKSSAESSAKSDSKASAMHESTSELQRTILACIDNFRWATRFFTDRAGARVSALEVELQWTRQDGPALLACRDGLHACVRAMTRFVNIVRKANAKPCETLQGILEALSQALGEYLLDGTCEVMGHEEEAELGTPASSGGFDTLLYLVSIATGSWQPALSAVNVVLAAEACPCADDLLRRHRARLGPSLLRAVAAQRGKLGKTPGLADNVASTLDEEQTNAAPVAEATILDAAELYNELGGEERPLAEATTVRPVLESLDETAVESASSLCTPAKAFFHLQVRGCLLYLDICQSGWDAHRHQGAVHSALAEAARLSTLEDGEQKFHSFVFPRLQKLALVHGG